MTYPHRVRGETSPSLEIAKKRLTGTSGAHHPQRAVGTLTSPGQTRRSACTRGAHMPTVRGLLSHGLATRSQWYRRRVSDAGPPPLGDTQTGRFVVVGLVMSLAFLLVAAATGWRATAPAGDQKRSPRVPPAYRAAHCAGTGRRCRQFAPCVSIATVLVSAAGARSRDDRRRPGCATRPGGSGDVAVNRRRTVAPATTVAARPRRSRRRRSHRPPRPRRHNHRPLTATTDAQPDHHVAPRDNHNRATGDNGSRPRRHLAGGGRRDVARRRARHAGSFTRPRSSST